MVYQRCPPVSPAPGLARVEDREDMWVAELRGDTDLVEESLGADRRGEVGSHHLQGDEAVVTEVAGEVHRRHAPLPELALDGVAAGECVLDLDRWGQAICWIPRVCSEARSASLAGSP